MRRARQRRALLAFALLGASAGLHAQARGPVRESPVRQMQVDSPPPVLDEVERAKRMAAMRAWLGHLSGRFEISSRWSAGGDIFRPRGRANCRAIGEGSGIRCVFQFEPEPHVCTLPADLCSRIGQPTGHVTRRLPMLFFGIDPATVAVQVVAVHEEQVGAQAGPLIGNAVAFSDNWNVCHRVWTDCVMVTEVAAGDPGQVRIHLVVDQYGQGRKNPMTTRSGHTADIELHLQAAKAVDPAASR